MKKYLVVSYDDDQQQWFWDYVAAKTAENAVAHVRRVSTSLRPVVMEFSEHFHLR